MFRARAESVRHPRSCHQDCLIGAAMDDADRVRSRRHRVNGSDVDLLNLTDTSSALIDITLKARAQRSGSCLNFCISKSFCEN